MIQRGLLTEFFRLQVYILTILPVALIQAQDGTYKLKKKNGSYGLISLIKNQNIMTAEIFTWWNTPSAQTGSYDGHGVLINNRLVLKSDENNPGCIVKILLMDHTIIATFEKCMTDHLTEDFNGMYRKISDATVGDYIVTANRSFFHSNSNEYSRQKSYLIKGDTVSYQLHGEAVGDWVFVHYRNKNGNDTSGHIKLIDLKKL